MACSRRRTLGGAPILRRDTQIPRVSTGLELQVLMPVVNAPFRAVLGV